MQDFSKNSGDSHDALAPGDSHGDSGGRKQYYPSEADSGDFPQSYAYEPPLPAKKKLNGKGKETNWPEFLVEASNQQLYGVASLIMSFMTSGVVGLVMAIYYLFILDDAYEKNHVAKTLNWVALLIPVGIVVLALSAGLLFLLISTAFTFSG